VSYAQLEAAGVFLVIVKLGCSYRRPGRYDDLLEVRTRVVGGSRVKIRHEYEVVRVESGATASAAAGISPSTGGEVGEVLMVAETVLACIDQSGRPTLLPEWLVQAESRV